MGVEINMKKYGSTRIPFEIIYFILTSASFIVFFSNTFIQPLYSFLGISSVIHLFLFAMGMDYEARGLIVVLWAVIAVVVLIICGFMRISRLRKCLFLLLLVTDIAISTCLVVISAISAWNPQLLVIIIGTIFRSMFIFFFLWKTGDGFHAPN